MTDIRHCDHVPSLRKRGGGDHTGVDVFMACDRCGLEGPLVECHRVTEEIRAVVTKAWTDSLHGVAFSER